MEVYLPEALVFMFVSSVVLLTIYYIGYFRMRSNFNKGQRTKMKIMLPQVVYGLCLTCQSAGFKNCSLCLKYFRESLDHINKIKGGNTFEV